MRQQSHHNSAVRDGHGHEAEESGVCEECWVRESCDCSPEATTGLQRSVVFRFAERTRGSHRYKQGIARVFHEYKADISRKVHVVDSPRWAHGLRSDERAALEDYDRRAFPKGCCNLHIC
jgi:hypothetical protein